jgi:2-hydroxy-3-oxopropionate reductase
VNTAPLIKVGFIGLGIMGRPMALNLLRAGYPLWVYARRPAAAASCLAAGALGCDSIAALARQVDIIFCMVSDTAAVEEVLFAEQGIARAAMLGQVVVDMSTIAPAATQDFGARLSTLGIELLDAPVSGGEAGAIAGQLSIMVGGKAEVFERVLPLLKCMGNNIVHIGGQGAGQVAKACNQIVVGVSIEAVAEALTFARRMGVDAEKVRAALLGGFAGSKVLEVHGKRILENNFQPGFTVALHDKDMRIVMEAAREQSLTLPAADLVAHHLAELMGAGDGALDSSAIVKVVARD